MIDNNVKSPWTCAGIICLDTAACIGQPHTLHTHDDGQHNFVVPFGAARGYLRRGNRQLLSRMVTFDEAMEVTA